MVQTASGQKTGAAYSPELVPDLTDAQFSEIANRHLATLRSAERTAPLMAPRVGTPRVRRAMRRLWWTGVWLREMVIRPWGYVWDPRRPLGRLWNHIRLWEPSKTFNWWQLGLLALAVLSGIAAFFWLYPMEHKTGTDAALTAVASGLFASSTGGLIASLWKDLVRSPWLCYRVRKRIKARPECILDENLGMRPVKAVSHDDPIEIAVRADLLSEVLPGIFTRDKKDVQILVGEPGAGKTTALVLLAKVLARVGILPVLVPLRCNEGAKEKIKLSEKARMQFVDQIDRFVRSGDEAEKLWRWMYKRRRVAILADDVDQIGADGERGAILRQTLEDAMTLDLPVLVTARPAGLPAGIAVSAISLTPMEDEAALKAVIEGASKDPAFKSQEPISPPQAEDWIREGEFTQVPFYLELLASVAADKCPKLPQMDQLATSKSDVGRYQRMPDGRYKWNPLWVRFLLLERFYADTAAGKVRRWLGIEAGERRSSLVALEGAALGTLVAAGMKARAAQKFRGQPQQQIEKERPGREDIVDFLAFEDRDLANGGERGRGCSSTVLRRGAVSAHEAADTGERLRILERDFQGKLQFRHRIMQAYLAGSRLAVILYERLEKGELTQEQLGIDEGKAQETHTGGARGKNEPQRWVSWLLDPHHPEKLTANMALTFAVLAAKVEQEAAWSAAEQGAARGGEQGAAVSAAAEQGLERHGQQGTESAAEQSAAGQFQQRRKEADMWQGVQRHIVERMLMSAEESLHLVKQNGGAYATALLTVQAGSSGMTAALGLPLSVEGADGEGRRPYDPSSGIDPKIVHDPDVRLDPDDALMKLTAAAEAAHAIGYRLGERANGHQDLDRIVQVVGETRFSTRWPKLQAIKSMARLGASVSAFADSPPAEGSSDSASSAAAWKRIWEFARDRDYQVRQAAGNAMSEDAYNAFRALKDQIRTLILRAAARSALGLQLHIGEDHDAAAEGDGGRASWLLALAVTEGASTVIAAGALPGGDGAREEDDTLSRAGVEKWREEESLSLEALGVVLPAIVSGLREDPEVHALETWQGREAMQRLDGERPSRSRRHREEMSDVDYRKYSEVVHSAQDELLQLVALAFQGYQYSLEDALARGFKADAMRHAHDRGAEAGTDRHAGPGWVASNQRTVLDVCVRRSGSWYSRLLLAQALALYAIAGAKQQEAYDMLAHQVQRGREQHPFTLRGARLARAAVRRSEFPFTRWHRWIWDDESEVMGRRQAKLNRPTSQLAADVTLLLDLKEGSPVDCQEPFGAMRELPYCLSASKDREEILGKGCADSCGWSFCPYKQLPPDEPDAQRGVSRAFCREQQRYSRHQPKWQTHIRRRKLRAFWEEMERRART